eukprot:gene16380-16558_t
MRLFTGFLFLLAISCAKPKPQYDITKVELTRSGAWSDFGGSISIDSSLNYKYYGDYGKVKQWFFTGKVSTQFWDTLNQKLKHIKYKTLSVTDNENTVDWLGKCPSCAQWNTFVEEVLEKPNTSVPNWKTSSTTQQRANKPVQVADITFSEEQRLLTPDKEFNRVLGGGIVAGSLVLIGGEPGIGKSTLMLQLALNMPGIKVLYVSGEESERQIKMRAERLCPQSPEGGAFGKDCFILTETSTQNIFKQIEALEPDLVVVDSIQTLHSAHIESTPGSVSQDGMIAGPKILEHMVDTVLQFEGDRHHVYRILRTIKNRFGSASELGIYEMLGEGLREVSNPSEILLSQRDEALSGITISTTLEGMRPMMIETQALVSTSPYGTPQRTATGFDTKRMSMLLAVLEKRCGFNLGNKDVFLNITGGIRVEDPAIDLGLAAAIISSHQDIPISFKTCFAGEVGLSGEIRAVNRVEQRIAEAQKIKRGSICRDIKST